MKQITLLLFLMAPFLGFSQVDLPITFEDTATVDYMLSDFGGNESMIVVDPTDATNLVGQATKNGPETWAGTTMGGNGLANAVPLTSSDSKMTVRVWSPTAGTPVRLKLENTANGGIFAETETNTTLAESWETIEFDFANPAAGSIDLSLVYDKVVIFFNFGTIGTGEVYYWDDVIFTGGGGFDVGSEKDQVDLPITFEDTATVNYALAGFGGNESMIVVDPTDATNLVGQATKNGPETWAGTTIGGDGLASPIAFAEGSTKMTVRVWSPTAGIPIRLKTEKQGTPEISVETETLTTVAEQWEMLEFDFSQQAEGTAAIDFANTYDKISIFFDFGTVGEGQVYYWDDMIFLEEVGGKSKVDLPITFEDTATVDYVLGDFGGNVSMIVVDPTDATNLVGQAMKNEDQTWGGTTVGGDGLANPIPFDAMNSKMSVRVWSPTAGTPIRLKAENAGNGGIFAEVETITTVAEAWETLEFDFADLAGGVMDLNNVYDKVSIFFNFGTLGTGEVYYWDDIIFTGGGGFGEMVERIDFPITFEDTASLDYALVDFAGNVSSIVADPTDATNLVGQAIRSSVAETFAGTVVGNLGLENPIPFTVGDSKISVRVWSADAGIPVMLKVENVANAGIFIETQDTTTLAGEWETLTFDFSVPTNGEYNLENVYDKLIIFFNFGATGADAGEQTYYWDDMIFLLDSGVDVIDFADKGLQVTPNPASDFIKIEIPNESFRTNLPVSIFDANGRLLRQEYLTNSVSRINVSDLGSGMYYLRINAEGYQLVHRLMIAK